MIAIPRVKPYFKALYASRDGRIWAQHFVPAEYREQPPRPAGDERPILNWREPIVLDAFEPEGTFLGTVTLPRDVHVLAIDGDRIWVVHADEAASVARCALRLALACRHRRWRWSERRWAWSWRPADNLGYSAAARAPRRPPMSSPRSSMIAVVTLATLATLAPTRAQESTPTVLRARTLFDGRGNTLHDRDVVVQGDRVVAVVPAGEGQGAVVDLGDLTLLPGLIDTHVHMAWHFDRNGRIAGAGSNESAEEAVLRGYENAWATVWSGVTTVQSMGAPVEAELRDAIARGVIPGPRILTSLGSLSARVGDPEAMRVRVREMAEAGADVIKVFASASIRDGGGPTLSQEQLDAACGEAAALGLRAVVHAHGPESAARASRAGCTAVEHGALLDRATLELLAANGTYYDPNIDLVFRNYFENQDRYLGVGNYTAEGFAQMRQAVPRALAAFQEAQTVPGLKIVFGTDAVAGAHGRNAQELVYRVRQGGQTAMDAVVSATSLAAASLGLGDQIGALVAGMAADLIATAGNPAEDIGALERVVFVMRAGRVLRHDAHR